LDYGNARLTQLPLNYRVPAYVTANTVVPLFGAPWFGLVPAYMARNSSFGSGHTGGANFCFIDGSVRFVADTINGRPDLYYALSTIDGGEVTSGIDY
jgi:prepilin-type processing-associated H-X9-DG protein